MKNMLILAVATLVLAAGCNGKESIKYPEKQPRPKAERIFERRGVITTHGRPAVLLGPEIRVGDRAPNFTTIDRNFMKTTLKDFDKKVLLIFSLPSLDTQVCKTETVRFNKQAARMPEGVAVIAISNDLPFTQSRFCSTLGDIEIEVLSDAVTHDFGRKYSVLIKDMGLLARAVFVVNREGKIVYVQIVPEISKEPDYEAALEAARDAAQKK